MINLDIAGFYYRLSVPAGGIVTVLDLMNAARGVRASNGGVLDFRLDFADKFVETISVDYDRTSNPESRQQNLTPTLPKRRPTGLYSFTDDVTDPANRISSPGRVPGLHAWQYYISDSAGLMKSQIGPTGVRGIAPAAESDQPPFGAPLADGDTVVWRLLGIFGLNHFFDSQRTKLLAKSGGRPLGLKAAIEMMKEADIDLKEFAN